MPSRADANVVAPPCATQRPIATGRVVAGVVAAYERTITNGRVVVAVFVVKEGMETRLAKPLRKPNKVLQANGEALAAFCYSLVDPADTS